MCVLTVVCAAWRCSFADDRLSKTATDGCLRDQSSNSSLATSEGVLPGFPWVFLPPPRWTSTRSCCSTRVGAGWLWTRACELRSAPDRRAARRARRTKNNRKKNCRSASLGTASHPENCRFVKHAFCKPTQIVCHHRQRRQVLPSISREKKYVRSGKVSGGGGLAEQVMSSVGWLVVDNEQRAQELVDDDYNCTVLLIVFDEMFFYNPD